MKQVYPTFPILKEIFIEEIGFLECTLQTRNLLYLALVINQTTSSTIKPPLRNIFGKSRIAMVFF